MMILEGYPLWNNMCDSWNLQNLEYRPSYKNNDVHSQPFPRQSRMQIQHDPTEEQPAQN